jgi:hypothetical protein
MSTSDQTNSISRTEPMAQMPSAYLHHRWHCYGAGAVMMTSAMTAKFAMASMPNPILPCHPNANAARR